MFNSDSKSWAHRAVMLGMVIGLVEHMYSSDRRFDNPNYNPSYGPHDVQRVLCCFDDRILGGDIWSVIIFERGPRPLDHRA